MNYFQRLLASWLSFDWVSLTLLCLVGTFVIVMLGLVGCSGPTYKSDLGPMRVFAYTGEGEPIELVQSSPTPPPCKALEYETEPNNCKH